MIGDTVLLRADNRRGVDTIVDTDAVRYKVCWRNEKASCPGMSVPNWRFPDLISDGDGHDGGKTGEIPNRR